MTTVRPSSVLMAGFVALAGLLVTAAAAPLVHVATLVV